MVVVEVEGVAGGVRVSVEGGSIVTAVLCSVSEGRGRGTGLWVRTLTTIQLWRQLMGVFY